MNKADFRSDLEQLPVSFLVSKWIIDRVPAIFGTDNLSYIEWKEELCKRLQVDSRAMLLIGSACCGFSLNPYKNLRDFDSDSDIDIALVSNRHFDLSWHVLRNLGSRYYSLTPRQKNDVDEHRNRLVYYGCIATDKILPLLPFAKAWIPALEETSSNSQMGGREAKVRVYRDFESLRAYQKKTLETIRTTMLSHGSTP